jgi:hypothetical protein
VLEIPVGRTNRPGFPIRCTSTVTRFHVDLLDQYLFSRGLFGLVDAGGVDRLPVCHEPVGGGAVGQNGVTEIGRTILGVNGWTCLRVRGLTLPDSDV